MTTLELDGSYGEGGGQILRTALAMSAVTGRPFKLSHIRRGRRKPGLMPQHVTCAIAASEICNAEVRGAESGSGELLFVPGEVVPGTYSFDIETAGSCSLVLQALLPLLLNGRDLSVIKIKGGTHVFFSPLYHYLTEVFFPLLKRIGVTVEATIKEYGFYPVGGGEVSFRVHPLSGLKGLHMSERGRLTGLSGYSAVARLPMHIAERQKSAMEQGVGAKSAHIRILNVPSPGHGTFAFLKASYEESVAGFSSLGKRGKPAEEVGAEAAAAFMRFHETPAALDPYMADQIVPYLALAPEGSLFTTAAVTEHLLTNLWVTSRFIPLHYSVDGEVNSRGTIRIEPADR